MKKLVVFLVAMTSLVVSFSCLAAADEKPVLAVVDFTNNSGRVLSGIGEAAAEVLTTLLAQSEEFSVVEREKLRTVVTEQNLAASGLAAGSVQLGRLLGADYLVTGSVISYSEQKSTFQGYGITFDKLITQLAVNVKLLDINSGQIKYAGIFSDKIETGYASERYYGTMSFNHDLLVRVLQAAANQLLARLAEEKPEVIADIYVHFESDPAGADVEVDGIFVGTTPLVAAVKPGLHDVTISYPGYEPWQKTIDADKDMRLKAILAEKTTQLRED